jgi:hypothetical protein
MKRVLKYASVIVIGAVIGLGLIVLADIIMPL